MTKQRSYEYVSVELQDTFDLLAESLMAHHAGKLALEGAQDAVVIPFPRQPELDPSVA